MDCVQEDMSKYGRQQEDTEARHKWRTGSKENQIYILRNYLYIFNV